MKAQLDTNTRMQRTKNVVCSRYFVIGGILVILLPVALSASTIGTNGMYHFVAGTSINPDEVNANFDYFANSISVKDGNVGIGTASPGRLLHLYGSNGLYERLESGTDESAGLGFEFVRPTDGTRSIIQMDPSKEDLEFYTGGSLHPEQVHMLIDKGGDVGIGTSTPAQQLHTIGRDGLPSNGFGGSAVARFQGSNASVLDIGHDNSNPFGNWLQSYDNRSGNSTRYPLLLNPVGGSVGIGTTTPGAALEVDGTALFATGSGSPYRFHLMGDGYAGFSTGVSITSDAVAGKAYSFINGIADFNGTPSTRFQIDSNGSAFFLGNVAIGTTTTSYRLEVNGAIHASGGVSVMGDVISDDYLYNSDARLKQDIAPLEHSSEGIACLQGVTYRWNDATAARSQASQDLQIGLIAQDVETCFPEVVTTAPDGYKSVSYARLVAPLIEAVKDQQRVNRAQQQTLSAQQSELEAIKARLARLETMLRSPR